MKSLIRIITLLVLSWFALLMTIASVQSQPVAIHPDRDKLFEDALSWLTLRQNGELLSAKENSLYASILRDRYRSSRYYRTFVIAFQFGVLPKLTLKEGQLCDPAYTFMYKHPINNSVTWYSQKKFTLENYYKRSASPSPFPAAYCDYRKGLVCVPSSKKCECPEGSKMSPIGSNSKEQRCLLEEDQPCAFVDFAMYDIQPRLNEKIPEIVFNLEKPLGCKFGTQCRFKDTKIPHCFDSSKGPFNDENWNPELKYGEECVLGYTGKHEVCKDTSFYARVRGGFICFNFWGFLRNRPIPSGASKLKGFCGLDVGPYITPGLKSVSYSHQTGRYFHDPFVTAFVNPRTVPPIPLPDLLAYDNRLHDITQMYRQYRVEVQDGYYARCSVDATAKLLAIWNFYAGLEKNPPTGKDFIADIDELNMKLDEFETLIGNRTKQPKICRIHWEVGNIWGYAAEKPPLTCISESSSDKYGNDGTCQLSNNNESLSHALNIRTSFHNESTSHKHRIYEENEYDPTILQNHPDAKCSPSNNKGKKRRSVRSATLYRPSSNKKERHIHGSVLEGGLCSDGYVCYEDFSETHGIYNKEATTTTTTESDGYDYEEEKEEKRLVCELIPSYKPQYACINMLASAPKLEGCEEQLIKDKIEGILSNLTILGLGSICSHEMEKVIRHYVTSNEVRYRVLLILKDLSSQGIGICDPTRLLECSAENTCKCISTTAVRVSADNQSTSDYCYLTSGLCQQDVTKLIPMTETEKEAVRAHYGDNQYVGKDCSNGNICVFVDSKSESGVCTTTNTGTTGVDVTPDGGNGGGGGGGNAGGGDGNGGGNGNGAGGGKRPIGRPALYGHGAPSSRGNFETMIIILFALLYTF